MYSMVRNTDRMFRWQNWPIGEIWIQICTYISSFHFHVVGANHVQFKSSGHCSFSWLLERKNLRLHLVILQFWSRVFAKFVTCSNFSTADVSSSVFVQPLLLIEFVQKIQKIDVVDRNLTKHEYDKVSMLSPELMQNALCKSEIQMYVVVFWISALEGPLGCEDWDNRCRKYRIAGLSGNPTNDLR
jgi:hypothetical protein